VTPAELHWVKRDMAIARLYAALCNGGLIAMVRDPMSGLLFRFIGTDWKEAAFWRDTIVAAMCAHKSREEGSLVAPDRKMLEQRA
jgi:hypothetical protein